MDGGTGWWNGSYRDGGYVLKVGSIVLEGTGKELLSSDTVRKAYLGED